MRAELFLAFMVSVFSCYGASAQAPTPVVEVHEVPLGTMLPCFAVTANPLPKGFVWADGKNSWPDKAWVPQELRGKPVPNLNGSSGTFVSGGDPASAYVGNIAQPQDGVDFDSSPTSVAAARKAGIKPLRVKNDPANYSAAGYFFCVQGPTNPLRNPFKPPSHPSNKPPAVVDLAMGTFKPTGANPSAGSTTVNGTIRAGLLPNSMAGGMYGFSDDGEFPGVHVPANKIVPKNFPVRWIIRIE